MIGRPRININFDFVDLLKEAGFTFQEIAHALQVSRTTLWRRISENNMLSNFTDISDYQLDELVQELQLRFPNSGQVILMGHLRSRGVIVPRHRLRDSIVRIDPLSSQLRWRDALQRRTYSVPHANSLWHIDGHHSLVRWRFVVHGGIDGFSHLIVYLSCSTNNKSSTVLSLLLEAVQTYGRRKGGENKGGEKGGRRISVWLGFILD